MNTRTGKFTSREAKQRRMQFARLCALAVISCTCCDDDRSLVIVTPRSRHCVPRGNEKPLIEYDASIELRPTVSTLHLLTDICNCHCEAQLATRSRAELPAIWPNLRFRPPRGKPLHHYDYDYDCYCYLAYYYYYYY